MHRISFKILKRNLSSRFSEVDIIAQSNNFFTFLWDKVKTRVLGYPEVEPTPNKIEKLQKPVAVWCTKIM